MMDHLAKHIASIKNRQMLVVGDIILDEYIHGTVGRISQEAPVPVIKLNENKKFTLGGGANMAQNLALLGCSVAMVGIVGNDKSGSIVRELMEQVSINTSGLVTVHGRNTTQKARVIGNGQQMLRIDSENTQSIEEPDINAVLDAFDAALPQTDVVVISDYAKGVLTSRILRETITRSKHYHIPVLVAPKGRDFERYNGCDLLVLNQFEAEIATGLTLHDADQLYTAVCRLHDQTGASSVLITLGERGMYLLDQGTDCHWITCEPREVFDVGGAGDTVLAVLAWIFESGNSCEGAARIANLAAGIVVEKQGVVPINREALLNRLLQHEHTNKIKAPDDLKSIILKLQEQDHTVVFTNGCFDLLHPGHIQLLRSAKQMGDQLIVAINTDESIRNLKGSGRPILMEQERAMMLGALDCVDYVVLFNDATPIPLLDKLRPDVLVKGGEYSHDQVVGWELVESYGGRISHVPTVPGISTTSIVDRILQNYTNESDGSNG